jgi:seryl-tRNA synthetase
MRGGGERERGGGGSAAWVGGAGEGGGEEAVRVRAKEKGKRRRAQEARRRERRSSSSDESRRTDGEGRERMTLREHVADAVHEAKERHAEHKALKAEQEERFGAVRAVDPDDVPLPEGVELPVTASAVAKDQ